MPVRNKILIVLGGLVVLLIFFLFVIFPIIRSPEPVQEVVQEQPQIIQPSELDPLPPDPPTNAQSDTSNTVIEPITNEQMSMDEASQRGEVERLSRLFVERFGSYSSFSNFSNIRGMEQFMTNSMRAYADSIIEDAEANPTSGYLGITTRILSLQIRSFTSEQRATVGITVQEERQQGLDADIERSFKDGTVELVYQDGRWLVDGVFYN